jgi:GNAT superfamily N-acetyltransferase
MPEISVRVLDPSEWSLYRDIRLRALTESPEAFTATLAEEADRDERFWRDRVTQARRLVAERDQVPLGTASLGPYEPDPTAAEVFGVYVVPEARNSGIAWRLVEAVADLAARDGYGELYYWVGTDNARAVGFGKNFGFETTGYRRPARVSDRDRGEEEMAMVLPLESDTSYAPNPTSDSASVREGPA